jgi:hypothetical protein
MGDADASAIHRELGHIAATLKSLADRIEHLEDKADKFAEAASDIKHMRGNIAMMKKPVEDYTRLKQRGIGAWSVVVLFAGAATTIFNIVSYIIRVYVLGIGNG